MGITSKATKKAQALAFKNAIKNGKVTTTKAKAKKVVKSVVKATVKTTKKDRAVTVEITFVNNKRSFRAVNKRAKAFAELSGKSGLTLAKLKAIKSLGFRVLETVTLTPVKF